MEAARVDRWLWAVRLYKTRSAATTACDGGHVKVNGLSAKPATRVRGGDRIEARTRQQLRVLEVAKVIDKRVGAAAAAECVLDHSPEPPPRTPSPAGVREPGTGRPTKRDRRLIERLRKQL